MSVDLDGMVKWLHLQLDEDDRAAAGTAAQWPPAVMRGALDGDVLPLVAWAAALHIQRQQPRHVLADVTAKRRLVEMCENVVKPGLDRYQARRLGLAPTARELDTAEMTLRMLTSGYAERDGYRAEWVA